MTRRTQAERSAATTAALVAAAQRSFGRDGYAATTMGAVAAAAGVTKGAAYHHFRDKAALFRVVFTREQERIAVLLEQAAGEAPDSWSGLLQGCRTFLEHCLDPRFRQIVLLDGPSALGWETVREIDHDHTLRVLTEGLRVAAADGRIVGGDLDARCQLIFGALCQAGMHLARSDDPAGRLPAVVMEAGRLLGSLAPGPPDAGPAAPAI